MPAVSVDGNDAIAVDAAVGAAVAEVRRGDGPRFVHLRTYRLMGHTSTDAAAWRPADEVASARAREPLARLAGVLAERGIATETLDKILADARAEMISARDAARSAPWPEAEERVRRRADDGSGAVAEMTLVEAGRRAALQEMRRDPTVWVLGEDVGRGGLWGQYRGFLEEFGPERVVSTPISESTIMGAGLGAALVGTRPIIEMRIFDFVMCAMDELVNQIAKVRFMFGGQAKPAVVVRMPHGMWRNSAAQHSQMLEAWFAHLPGVVVVDARHAGGYRRPPGLGDPLRRPGAVLRSEGSVCSLGGSARAARAGPVRRGADHAVRRRRDRGDLVGRRTGRGQGRRHAGGGRHSRRPHRPAHHLAVGRGGGRRPRSAAPGASWWSTRRSRSRVSAPKWWRTVIDRLGPAAIKAIKRLGAPRVPVPFAPVLENEVRVTPEKVFEAVKQLIAG